MLTANPPTDRPRARTIIVDDHPIFRRGLKEVITHEPDLEVCAEAADIAEALQLVDALKPDLVIVDISLRDGSGISLLEQIKARDNHVKTLVSSMHEESVYAERALRAGAMGYINKQEANETVVEAIREVLGGRVYLSGSFTNQVLQRVVNGEPVERSATELLSNRELEIFELIGQGLTTGQIARKLHRSVKTIETHRENIKNKLNLTSGAKLTRRAVQWVLERS